MPEFDALLKTVRDALDETVPIEALLRQAITLANDRATPMLGNVVTFGKAERLTDEIVALTTRVIMPDSYLVTFMMCGQLGREGQLKLWSRERPDHVIEVLSVEQASQAIFSLARQHYRQDSRK